MKESNAPVIREPSGVLLPALISGAGERAAWRFLEFFTVNIRNSNTRAAYGRAAGDFLRGLYRGIAGQAFSAYRQATPGLHPHAV